MVENLGKVWSGSGSVDSETVIWGMCGVVQDRVHWRNVDREKFLHEQRLLFRFTRRIIKFF